MSRILQVVLPSYNEEIALSRLIPQFEELDRKIDEEVCLLVVDDGSKDGTGQIAEDYEGAIRVSLVQFPENRGYGVALETGVTQCAQALGEDDLIATMDADDTHSPAYLQEMIDALDSHSLDVVIASRFAPGGKEVGVPWLRRILSRGAGRLYGMAFGLPGVGDYSCGYRLFRTSIIKRVLDECGSLGLDSGFQATGELLLRLREQTDRIGEVPFELHYERKPTASKMKTVQTVFGTIRFLLKVRSRLRNL